MYKNHAHAFMQRTHHGSPWPAGPYTILTVNGYVQVQYFVIKVILAIVIRSIYNSHFIITYNVVATCHTFG